MGQDPPGSTVPGTSTRRSCFGSIHTNAPRTLVWTLSGRNCASAIAGRSLIVGPIGFQMPSLASGGDANGVTGDGRVQDAPEADGAAEPEGGTGSIPRDG